MRLYLISEFNYKKNTKKESEQVLLSLLDGPVGHHSLPSPEQSGHSAIILKQRLKIELCHSFFSLTKNIIKSLLEKK